MAAPKPTTAPGRAAAKAAQTRKKRMEFYAARIRQSRTGREQLGHATDFAKAVGDELGDAGRRDLALAITRLVEERTPK